MNTAGVDAHRLGEKRRFRVLNAACLASSCFDPGVLRNEFNAEVPTCLTRARCTCPELDQRGHSGVLAAKRELEGWRVDP